MSWFQIEHLPKVLFLNFVRSHIFCSGRVPQGKIEAIVLMNVLVLDEHHAKVLF